MNDIEEWRSVPGFAGYEISNLGRVRALPRTFKINGSGATRSVQGRALRPTSLTMHKGYLRCRVRNSDGARTTLGVGKMVLEAFRGPPPEGMYRLLHADRDPSNCKLDNLSWASPKVAFAHLNDVQPGWSRAKFIAEPARTEEYKNRREAAIMLVCKYPMPAVAAKFNWPLSKVQKLHDEVVIPAKRRVLEGARA